MSIKSPMGWLLLSSTFCLLSFAESNLTPSSDTVVVEIDGAKLTYGAFEDKLSGNIFQARNAFYEAERKALDEFVDNFLLEREAKKENVTVAELLERHVNSAIPKDPSEEALKLYYEVLNTKEPYEKLRPQMIERLRQLRIAKAKAAYMETLHSQAKVVVNLTPPRAQFSLKDAMVRGDEKAPVTIIEYADYECPYCQQTQPALEKVEAEYKGKIAFAFRDVPLPMHSHAQKAAEAAHCAGAQGKFWEYHDMLFSTKQLDVPQLREHARALNLDVAAFDTCLDSGATAEAVKAQLAEGQALHIEGTPSFLINGRFFNGGMTYEQLRTVVEEELHRTAEPVKQAANK
ncbi:MAG: thioredoxin domain-containing protein [Bryobacteraceae bacterium]|jgi:protein-disulfide isomerase